MTNQVEELLSRDINPKRNNTKESNLSNVEKDKKPFVKTSVKIINHRDKESLINFASTTSQRNLSEGRSKETSPNKDEQLNSLKKEIEFIKSKLRELNFEKSNKISIEENDVLNNENFRRNYTNADAFGGDTKIKDNKIYFMTNSYNYSKSKSGEKKNKEKNK